MADPEQKLAGKGDQPDPVAAALEEHIADIRRTLPGGDPREIKRMYVDFGEKLQSALGTSGEVPTMSVPEMLPVIAGLLEGSEGRILDAGCGPNPVASVALGTRPGDRTVVALDISLGNVTLACRVAARAGVSMLGVVGDLEALPFAADVFDACVCDDTIEHLPDDGRGARELSRVMKPRGRMVLATPNRKSLLVTYAKVRDRLGGRRRADDHYYAVPSHLREYTWGELERLIEPYFEVVSRATVGWSGNRKLGAASKLVAWPLFRRFGRAIVLEVERRRGD